MTAPLSLHLAAHRLHIANARRALRGDAPLTLGARPEPQPIPPERSAAIGIVFDAMHRAINPQRPGD